MATRCCSPAGELARSVVDAVAEADADEGFGGAAAAIRRLLVDER